MKKIALLIMVLICISGVNAEVRGLTCRELAEPQEAAGGMAARWQGSRVENRIESQVMKLDREGWELADSVDINTFLKAGEHIVIEYNGVSHQIAVSGNDAGLCALARTAIERAPAWIRAELSTTLGLLEVEYQEIWASVINEVDDPIVDEVAFCIATASDEYLQSEWAYPELYIQNAEMIYEYDAELSYVEVVDYGNSLLDDDYYSTTRYWSKTANGAVHQVEVPREIYYWHIVHPKITDEIPAFINPDIVENNSSHNTNIVGPDEGYFWRDFLYNYADDGYPSLRNYLVQCDYTNDFTTGYESAIGACTQWLGQSLQFTSNYERPHQPVRIYRKHIGRCGEHADMRVAIGRIALVPMTSIVCFTVDHTWNEFWDGEWIHWDGGSINNYYMYEQGWGSNFGSVIDVRSDGLMTPVTEKYAPNYADLIVHATDAEGNPLDGARLLIGLRLNNQVTGDMVGWTDNAGVYNFPIGDGHEYWVSMSTSWGSVEYQMITESTQGGEVYEVELSLNNVIPQINFSEIEVPADDYEDYRLVVEYEAEDQVTFGNIVMDDTSEDTWFYERRDLGAVNFFMSDMVHYFSYTSGIEFDAFNCISESDLGYFGFDMPEPAYGTWYAVIDNSNNINNPQWVKGSIALYHWEGIGGSAILGGTVTDLATGEVLAGAEVKARGFSTFTGEDGYYSMTVYPGEYDVTVDHALYEEMRYEGIELNEGEEYELNAQLSDDQIKPQNLIVNGDDETPVVVSWDAPESLLERSLMGYRVYRLLAEDEFDFENWELLTTDILAETEYTDEEWLSLPAGEYRYAVSAVYSQASSDFALSAVLPLYMTAEVEIMITTNSGDNPGGALVILENTEGVNSPYNYEIECPQSGSVILPEVWKGNYQIYIELEHFATVTDSLIITGDDTYNYELIELLPSVGFVGVYDYYLDWDAVPSNRTFEEYQIYLDGSGEILATVTEPGLDLVALGVDDQTHSIEVYAAYSSGVSIPAEVEFTDGSSLEFEQLAYFSFDQDFIDSVSGWVGTSETVLLGTTPFGNGAQFNGADYITIPANEELTGSALHYTTLFWINAETANTGWRGVMGRPGRNQCIWLNADNDYVHHRFHTTSGGTNDGAPNTPNGSFHWQEWNQVAIVNDGLKAKTYINGELLAEGYLGSALVADSTDMYIGKSPDSPTAEGYLYGMVDEVRIWNRGLADHEIKNLYLAETAVLGSGTLTGEVANSLTGHPLQYVVVSAGMFEAVTDADGEYEIILPARTYDITFSLLDFLDQGVEDFVVSADEVNVLDFAFELTGDDDDNIPSSEALMVKCYPNPFWVGGMRSSGVSFEINWQKQGIVSGELEVFNIRGQKVYRSEVELSRGINKLTWNGDNQQLGSGSSGVYFYQVTAEDHQKQGKLLMLK